MPSRKSILEAPVYLLLLAALAFSPAMAQEDPDQVRGQAEYDQAMQNYKLRNYQAAAKLFWDSIVAGNPLPLPWLMAAHANAGAGKNTEARRLYAEVLKTFPSSREAQAAKQCLIKLKGKPDRVVEDQGGAVASTTATSKASASVPPIKPDSDLAKAISELKKKNYDQALAYTASHLKKDPGDPNAYYYQALCHHYKGKTAQAVSNYQKVVEISPDSSLGARARSVLNKLAPGSSPAKATAVASTASASKSDPALVNKINVLKTLDGRAPVRQATVESAKYVIRCLPPKIAEMLFKGGATINLASNMVDKWPDSLHEKHPSLPDVYLRDEPGRTYGHDVYIYEAAMYPDSGRLCPRYPQDQVRHRIFHELGHAIDDLNGKLTNVDDLKNAYKEDKKHVPGNVSNLYPAYTNTKADGYEETVAEIIGGLIGCREKETRIVTTSFPRVTRWLQIRLGL